MPTGVQLVDLITDVRAEAGYSLNEAHGRSQRETIARRLRRKQTTLWNAFDWPMHSYYWDVAVEAGDRYVNYPSEVDQTRVNCIALQWDDRWVPLARGVGLRELNLYNSDNDEQSFPPSCWDHRYQTGLSNGQLGQIEVWPIPNEACTLRVWGHETLPALVADTDRCTLDSDMLILYVAGELLMREDKADAQLKLGEAEGLRRNILGQSDQSKGMAVYGGASRSGGARRGIDFVTKRSGT